MEVTRFILCSSISRKTDVTTFSSTHLNSSQHHLHTYHLCAPPCWDTFSVLQCRWHDTHPSLLHHLSNLFRHIQPSVGKVLVSFCFLSFCTVPLLPCSLLSLFSIFLFLSCLSDLSSRITNILSTIHYLCKPFAFNNSTDRPLTKQHQMWKQHHHRHHNDTTARGNIRERNTDIM